MIKNTMALCFSALLIASCGSNDIDDYREDRKQLEADVSKCAFNFSATEDELEECRRLDGIMKELDREDRENGTGKYSPEAKAAREAKREASCEAARKAQDEMNQAIKKNLDELDMDIKWGPR